MRATRAIAGFLAGAVLAGAMLLAPRLALADFGFNRGASFRARGSIVVGSNTGMATNTALEPSPGGVNVTGAQPGMPCTIGFPSVGLSSAFLLTAICFSPAPGKVTIVFANPSNQTMTLIAGTYNFLVEQ